MYNLINEIFLFTGANYTTSGCSGRLVHSDGRVRLLNENTNLPEDKPLTDQTLQMCQLIEECNTQCKTLDKVISSISDETLFPAIIGR